MASGGRGFGKPSVGKNEKSEERTRQVNGSMAARTGDYLESLLTDAFKGKGFQKISELLQEREIEPPQKYSESLFNQLDKVLRKELDKNEFQNVSLLLKCIQLYFKSDLQEGTSLFIEQGLVLTDSFNFYLVSWFERARAFVILIDPDENKFLMLLLEDFFDSALVKLKLADEYDCIMYLCKNYDLQVALSEALCRLMTKKWRDDLVHHWFEDSYLAEAFKEIKDREFETVKKPSDEKLEEFWIDFNTGSQSVTFYVDKGDGEKIVKIYMKIPATLNKTEATKIKISFSAEFEILSVLKKVLGDEKMMQKQIKHFIVAPEGEAVVSFPPSATKSNTPSPRTKAKPSEKPLEEEPMEESTPKKDATWEKRNRKTSLAKQRTEGRKEIYDFENSDSASHEKVAEAKGRILGQKVSSQNQRSYEMGNKNEESNKLERRPKFHDASGELSREEESFKRKDSDILSGTVIKKPKFSSWETSNLSSDTSCKPRKLFDSVEKEAEIQTGQEMGDGVDDAFFSKMLREDFTDSGVITAFESFIGQLKKLFWSRYKRMETSAQNTLRSSEKNVSALLNQIHQCRLSKLETFQKIVVEELASLEKETQILANMEKDAVVCVTSRVPACGGTPSQYERPMKKAVENDVFVVPSD
ncbi:PREDICTED: synaptonemal complex protein 2-like [Aptenodytes forsteri]|uniref:synaptonemal complex protein 2-like n=1 Tax=Aptenodytes forsteri TaxID=9233 RepID=UPI0004F4A2B3|nr:PREDICTED: synaptonemal complex protein 2-like [Aptenodytes forsteri]